MCSLLEYKARFGDAAIAAMPLAGVSPTPQRCHSAYSYAGISLIFIDDELPCYLTPATPKLRLRSWVTLLDI